MRVSCGPGGVVHDYVPFYFCARSSMLLSVVNAKNVDQIFLIHLAVPVNVLDRHDAIYSSAAANTFVPPTFHSDPAHLGQLNWDAIDSNKWSLPTEGEKQAKMAELLIHELVPVSQLDHIVVWNEEIANIVREEFSKAGVECPQIHYDGYNGKHHVFTSFYEGSTKSIVTGPHFTKRTYEKTRDFILEKGQNPSAGIANISQLLELLRGNFGGLPETAELIGLESDNRIHREDVGTHTLAVVQALRQSQDFATLNDSDKRLTELAAFLHDIGKGPKSRWANNGGLQKVDPDHAIRSVEMLRRILTEEIRTIKPRSVRVLAKLVCYHDLVGDIVGRNRDAEQLEAIAGSERELDMLIAIAKADMHSLNPGWPVRHAASISALRSRVMMKLSAVPAEDEE